MTVEALRAKLLEGLEPLGDFAKAAGKHKKTMRRLGVPVTYIGRTPYVNVEAGRAWLLNGCRPVDAEPRGRGRPRASAGAR
jgi:hypothetical protein